MKRRSCLALGLALILFLAAMPAALAATLIPSDTYCPSPRNGNQHRWGDWDILEQPTCSREGKRERVCSLCR